MLLHDRRLILFLMSTAALVVFLAKDVDAQKDPGDKPPLDVAKGSVPSFQKPGSEAFALPIDENAVQKLKAVDQLIAETAWREATQILQSFLDSPEDSFILAAPLDGPSENAWRNLRSEATRRIGSMPPAGRHAYELFYNPSARALLDEARKKENPVLLAQAAQRYPYTTAGNEAANLLGTYHLDRGKYFLAAMCFDQLLDRTPAETLSPLTLFKAALAFRLTENLTRAEQTWKRLAASAPDGVKLGDQRVGLTELRKYYDGSRAEAEAPPRDWSMFAGSARRSSRGSGGDPVLEARWKLSTVADVSTQLWIESAVGQLKSRSQPALPASFPLAVSNRVIFRSHRGVAAVAGDSGKLVWESGLLGSLERLAGQAEHYPHVNTWADHYLQGHPHVLLENSVVGSLSTDGARVYAVDDLVVPPYRLDQGLRLALAPQLTDAVQQNRLLALDLKSGKLVWELGGLKSRQGDKESSELFGSYFLGPPLPLGGKLYAVLEAGKEMHLCCLDAERGTVHWTQPLGTPHRAMLLDGGRRLHAVHLTAAEGILLCPTNAGAVLAVDPLTRSFLWAHVYRTSASTGPRLRHLRPPEDHEREPVPNLSPRWRTSAPVVAEGKVVLAAPDSADVRCLRWRDGGLLWQVNRGEDDLYLAGVFSGKVVLVGRQYCRALSLADGREVWKVQTGLPSGRGVAVDQLYYLPLQAAGAGQPGIAVVEIAKGTVRAVIPSKNGEVPGNLIVHEGTVYSQNATAVMAYPQRKE